MLKLITKLLQNYDALFEGIGLNYAGPELIAWSRLGGDRMWYYYFSSYLLVLVLTKSSKSKQVISMELYNPSIRETQDENEKIKSALNQVAKNIRQLKH